MPKQLHSKLTLVYICSCTLRKNIHFGLLSTSAAALPAIRSIDEFFFTEPYRFATGLAISVILGSTLSYLKCTCNEYAYNIILQLVHYGIYCTWQQHSNGI